MEGVTVLVLTSVLLAVLVDALFRWVLWPIWPTTSLDPRVPKGSFGWPVIGESYDFYTTRADDFVKPRLKKYGPVFKTYFIGTPTVFVALPAFAKYIYTDRYRQFSYTASTNLDIIFGKGSITHSPEPQHSKLHFIVQGYLNQDALAPRIANISASTLSTLRSWARGSTVTILFAAKALMLKNVLFLLLSVDPSDPICREFVHFFQELELGMVGLPINFPGMAFRKGLKATKRLHDIIQGCINERRNGRGASGSYEGHTEEAKKLKSLDHDNLLDVMINFKDENGRALSDVKIQEFFLQLLFAAVDSTAVASTWVMKFLEENPEILRAVVKENVEIHQTISSSKTSITWKEITRMKYTSQVIQETMRILPVANVTMRKAKEDVLFAGYKIPKNWNVITVMAAIHRSSEFFSDPLKFDPSRFEKSSNIQMNTYMPFGMGKHYCAGAEFAKLELHLLIYHLTTQFRWERVGKDTGTLFYPFTVPKDGYPVTLVHHSHCDSESAHTHSNSDLKNDSRFT